MTNSKVAWVDWIISNKDYINKANRKAALSLLVDALTRVAQSAGNKFTYALIKHDGLIKTYEELGYMQGDSYNKGNDKKYYNMAAFTTIATAAGLAATAATTGASFAQASKQKKMQQKAEREADKALADARKKLDVNFYEGLSLQKEPYERAREAMLASGQQALQAAQEGETRGAAATAGRVAMTQGAAQRDIAGAQAERLLGLEKLAAGEDARLAGLQAEISLEEVAGKQLQAREAEQRKQLASQQALAGVGSMIQQGAALAPLFGKAPDAFDPTGASFQEVQQDIFNP